VGRGSLKGQLEGEEGGLLKPAQGDFLPYKVDPLHRIAIERIPPLEKDPSEKKSTSCWHVHSVLFSGRRCVLQAKPHPPSCIARSLHIDLTPNIPDPRRPEQPATRERGGGV